MYKFNVLDIHPSKGRFETVLNLQTCAMSIRGADKPENQDQVYHRSTHIPGEEALALLAVCDGMSGYPAGSFASELTIHVMTTELGKLFPHSYLQSNLARPTIPGHERLHAWLPKIVQEANRLIYNYGQQQDENIHTGTRMTLALIQGQSAYIAHVGDTRAYLWRNRNFTQITKDHTYVAELANEGLIEKTKIAQHPYRKIISRAIGTQPEVVPAIYSVPLCPGDKFMLCSDGLWAASDDTKWMGQILANNLPPSDLCAMLIEEARHPTNYDDISVALACIGA